jgi:Xaa-Pro aminopeptidase
MKTVGNPLAAIKLARIIAAPAGAAIPFHVMNAELTKKLAQVRALLRGQEADGLLVGKQSNFSWLACGGEAHVPLATDRAFGHLLVTRRGFHVLANRIEMGRLQDEVVGKLGAKPLLFEWADPSGAVDALKSVADPCRVISDFGDFGTQARPELFGPLRYSLQPAEVKRYRALGAAAEAAMREACLAIKPGMTEFEIAAELTHGAWRRNLTPTVVLVAVDERIRRYRHPVPTRRKLKRHAMLVLCARQHGMIVALTRIVHFGKLPAEIRRRHDAVCAVDVAFNWNTRPGTPVREVFRRGVLAYETLGFRDEWRLHHQGGPCGYEGRDYLGSFHAPGVVQENQPFAWNPSITGSKSEDTILAAMDGPEVITVARDWPMVKVRWNGRVIARPDVLVR